MSGMAGCREIRQALGVYVLGAIDPAERAQVEEHLASCPDCREELASLAGLPAMLRKVPIVEAERLAAPDSGSGAEVPSEALLTSLVGRTVNVRRIHRWRTVAAAAAVAIAALAGGAAVTSALQPARAVAVWSHTATGTGPAAGAVLTVKYRHMSWGTEMMVNVTGIMHGSVCDLEVTDMTGTTTSVGSWVSWDGSTWYPASIWVDERDLRAFTVTINGKIVASAVT
jgi:predicted anti-sigma-YlaC factor YlaD